MDLFQVLLNINDFQADETIYVVEPWTLESETKVLKEPDIGLIQIESNHLIFEYFLEVSIVKEILKSLEHRNLCMRDQCQDIIEYAIHDA
ncbi:hypothetical protein DX910_00900 [Acinetobacter haemolyticus]|uniref:Uncharacterized protein n=1 Tax=Acinetobacter suaedae TaxID=2609668 RepID=A0A5P1UW10_9GAMM|nr:hypothetical protein [Acinetobacter sp. C16S1]AZN67087.1 hypothetical protein DX910_00900 [Acinetobacter haemolyticus]QER40323.1 hypothetical protein F2A31_11670 [Acinetobacter sp. C16S1]